MSEELSVTKEQRETGRVRIATHTEVREALVDEDLAQERIEIEKVPVGRPVDRVPPVRQEGDTTVVPVVEEVLRVERQLVLKEEVRIRRLRTSERHRETVTLRHQEALVTRQAAPEARPDAPGPSGREDSTKPRASDRKV